MKNILNYFMMGVAVLGMSAALASCQKESASDKTSTPDTPAARVIHVDLDATVAETKASYAEKVVTIQDDDKLYIALTGPGSAWTATGTLTFATDKFSGDIIVKTGSYAGSDPITDAKDLTATFLPKGYDSVNYLSATGEATATQAFYAGAKSASVPQLVHLTATVSNQAGVAKTPLTLVPQNAVLCYSINANKLSAGAHTVSVSDGTTTISGSVTAVADAATTFAVAFPASVSAKDYTLSVVSYEKVVKTGKTLAAGKVVNIPVSALTPLFSVEAGKYVKFSPGNLQYTKSSSTWSFMANQYSTVETTDQNVGENYASQDVVSLFGWGTSGWNNGNAFYQPYNTSNATSGTYTSSNGYGYGPTDGSSLTGSYADADWGASIGSGWRTLTKDEWLYLFGMEANNTDKSGHARYRKYFRATVNGIQGIIVLPDDINGISDIPAESSRGTASTFAGKTYTTSAWAPLETAGAVFLPAAGFRYGTSVSTVGSSGYYWSSTPYGASKAYYLYFDSSLVLPAHSNYRFYGYSVRLVQDQQ